MATTSFDDVYAATAPRLIGQLYLVIGDLAEAQDCVQEAYARAWTRWDKLTRDGGDPVGWVRSTAYRLAVSRWRHHTAGLRAFMRHGAPGVVAPPSADTIAVRNALAELPLGLRAALVMYYLGGMPVAEVATALNLPQGTVKARLSRGRTAMAALLTDTSEFGDGAVEVAHV
ncbi:RNA polymerase sigma factor [Catenulispora rubra]|uniref:RNA polymerase sigma factor n=1 Tax=Catenulispora rubra TaxID=280293 RepID=UPI0018926F46|nr:SigE family RNA polymerase sigma factor [Catenulispora rubra]